MVFPRHHWNPAAAGPAGPGCRHSHVRPIATAYLHSLRLYEVLLLAGAVVVVMIGVLGWQVLLGCYAPRKASFPAVVVVQPMKEA